MAQGDVTLFDYLTKGVLSGEHDLQNNDIRVGFINNSPAAVASDEAPSFDDYNEVYGGPAPQGGRQLQNVTLVETAGDTPFDADNMQWTKGTGGPVDIYQAVIYNNSRSDNRAIAFVDMTADGGVTPVDLSATGNNIDLNWNANGIFVAEKS